MRTDHMRTYPKMTRTASSAALVLIGVLALYNWVLGPHVRYLRAIQRLETAVASVAEEKDRICEMLEAKRRDRRGLEQELAELEAGVFTVGGARTWLRSLLPAVEETGCAVLLADFAGDAKKRRIEDPNAPLAVEVSHLSLMVSGEPDQVMALLQRLEDQRPRAWIDCCQCDFPPGGAGPVECSLALTLYTACPRKELTGPGP